MLEIKVGREEDGTVIECKLNSNPVAFNAEFMVALDTIVQDRGKKFIGPALFCFIEKTFTEEEIEDGLNRATGSRKMTEFIASILPKKHEKPQNLQKNNKNTEKNNQKDKVKQKKPKVKVTEFDSFDDFIEDLEKSFRGE